MALTRSFNALNPRVTVGVGADTRKLALLATDLADRPSILADGRCVSDPTMKSTTIRVLLDSLGAPGSTLFVGTSGRDDLLDAFEAVLSSDGNLFPLLRRAGLLPICPAPVVGRGVRLSGGSYSSVHLWIDGDEPLSVKEIKQPEGAGNIDADIRLKNERDWLCSLPEPVAALFPRFRYTIEDDQMARYATEFFPSGTLAEAIFRGCMDGEQAFSVLKRIYSTGTVAPLGWLL